MPGLWPAQCSAVICDGEDFRTGGPRGDGWELCLGNVIFELLSVHPPEGQGGS
jgi:hypothetical protein